MVRYSKGFLLVVVLVSVLVVPIHAASASGNQPPDAPVLTGPGNGVTLDTRHPTLSWSASDPDGDSLNYSVYLDTSPDPSSNYACADPAVASCQAVNLAPDVTYYWKVVASDGIDQTPSAVWSMTGPPQASNHAPDVPGLTSPGNGDTNVSLSPTLSWSSGDADGDRVGYSLYLDTNPDPTTLTACDVTASSCQAGPLDSGTTYYWKVTASDGADQNTSSVWSFTTLPPLPNAPSNLHVTPLFGTTALFGWTNNSGGIDGTYLEKSTSGQNHWTPFTSASGLTGGFDDSSLSCGVTYAYRARAHNAAGYSDYSNIATASIGACAADDGLSAPDLLSPDDDATTSSAQPELSWAGNLTTTVHHVQIATDAGFTSLAQDEIVDGTSYSAYPLPSGVYYWRVAATRDTRASAWSAVRTLIVDLDLPGAPGLTSPGNGDTTEDLSPTLSWSVDNPGGGALTYTVYLDANANPSTALSCADPSAQSCQAGPLSDNTTYHWKVVASDGLGQIASSVWSFKTPHVVPNAPSNLHVTPLVGTTALFGWTNNSGDIDGTYLEKSTSGQNHWSLFRSVPGLTGGFDDSSLSCGVTYAYRARAHNPAGYSNYSNIATASMGACAADDGLSAPDLLSPDDNATTGSAQPELSWTGNPTTSAHHVQIATDAGFGALVQDEIVDGTSYTAYPLDGGVYYWRVAATRDSRASAWSAVRTLVVDLKPQSPDSFAADVQGSAILLSWVDSSGDMDGFSIERSTNGGAHWAEIKRPDAGASDFSDSSVACGISYSYRMRAYNGAGYSPYSAVARASLGACGVDKSLKAPRLSAPKNNALLNNPQPPLSWSANGGATGYRVQIARDKKFKSLVQDSVSAAAGYTPDTLGSGVYYWRAAALRGGSLGAWSSSRKLTIDVTPPAAPRLKSPLDGASLALKAARLVVVKTQDMAGFRFQVSTDPGFGTTVLDLRTRKTTLKLTGSQVRPGLTYYWRVAALDKAGNLSGWSAVLSFTLH